MGFAATGVGFIALLALIGKYIYGINSAVEYYENALAVKKKPQNVTKKNYQKLMIDQRYLGEKMMALYSQVTSDLDFTERQKDSACVFVCDQLKPVTLGSIKTLFGAAVGVPVFFEWETIEDVDLSLIRHKPIKNRFFKKGLTLELLTDKCSDSDINALKETFLLSDNAKKFALCCGLIEVNSNSHLYNVMMPLFVMSVSYLTAVAVNHNLKTFQRYHRNVRYGLYICYAALFSATFLSVKAFQEMAMEVRKKETACKLGDDYFEGGKEYFEKEEKRGKLIRDIVKHGAYYFDEEGTLVPYWFEPDKCSPSVDKKLLEEVSSKCEK